MAKSNVKPGQDSDNAVARQVAKNVFHDLGVQAEWDQRMLRRFSGAGVPLPKNMVALFSDATGGRGSKHAKNAKKAKPKALIDGEAGLEPLDFLAHSMYLVSLPPGTRGVHWLAGSDEHRAEWRGLADKTCRLWRDNELRLQRARASGDPTMSIAERFFA